jgi:hypothetical protein
MRSAVASRPRRALACAIVLIFAVGGVAHALADDSAPDEIYADGFDPPPVADFNYGANGLALTFSDESVDDGGGTIAAWAWDFGDGGNSTWQNPVLSLARLRRKCLALTDTFLAL